MARDEDEKRRPVSRPATAGTVKLSIIHARFDEEPESEPEQAEVEAARRECGPGAAREEVLREFGLC